ncbi:hypothetical protein CHL67_03725 [Prosthecochloris sp. GSB1]|nr:hypothetical protein CHL67_03725 [Prosthecochloris sp. GSB1]
MKKSTRTMPDTGTLPTHVRSDGVKGLAMMAPMAGLPVFMHALGGVILTGAGFAAIASFTSPFSDRILRAGQSGRDKKQPPETGPCSAPSIPEPIKSASRNTGGDDETSQGTNANH